MGPIWGRQDPGGPHVGPMNFAIWECFKLKFLLSHPKYLEKFPPYIIYYKSYLPRVKFEWSRQILGGQWRLGNHCNWKCRASENIFRLQCKRGSSKWASPHHKQFATFLRNFYIFKQLLGNFEIWASVRRTRRTLFSDALWKCSHHDEWPLLIMHSD